MRTPVADLIQYSRVKCCTNLASSPYLLFQCLNLFLELIRFLIFLFLEYWDEAICCREIIFPKHLLRGRIFPTTLLEKSDGLIEKSDGLIEKSDSFIEKSNGLIEKSDSLIEKSDGLIEKSDSLIENLTVWLKNLTVWLKNLTVWLKNLTVWFKKNIFTISFNSVLYKGRQKTWGSIADYFNKKFTKKNFSIREIFCSITFFGAFLHKWVEKIHFLELYFFAE